MENEIGDIVSKFDTYYSQNRHGRNRHSIESMPHEYLTSIGLDEHKSSIIAPHLEQRINALYTNEKMHERNLRSIGINMFIRTFYGGFGSAIGYSAGGYFAGDENALYGAVIGALFGLGVAQLGIGSSKVER
jgi:hypothetical protein